MKRDKIIDFRHEWMTHQDERDDKRMWDALEQAYQDRNKQNLIDDTDDDTNETEK